MFFLGVIFFSWISFFADYEIPNLQKGKISQIVIWVVDDIEGPDM